MRSPLTRSALVVVVGVVAACSTVPAGDDAVLSGRTEARVRAESESTTTTAGPTSTVPQTEADADDLPVHPDDARVLVTPTGVVVPVVSFTGDGYDVVTPCGVPGRVSWGVPIAEAQIVLDPGHGGDVETGAVGANGLAEKDLNLTLAKRAALELETRGISVVLTRTADYRMPLAVRAQIGNDLDAAAIVSLHHNGPEAAPSDGPGTEIFVQQASDESRRLGGTIYGAVTAALGRFDIAWQAAPDAGVLAVINNDDEDSYGMIRRPEIPAVLVEFGYLANPVEAELFATEAYIAVTADALADGIESWLTSDAEGRGFVDEARRFTPSGLTGGSNGCIDPALE